MDFTVRGTKDQFSFTISCLASSCASVLEAIAVGETVDMSVVFTGVAEISIASTVSQDLYIVSKVAGLDQILDEFSIRPATPTHFNILSIADGSVDNLFSIDIQQLDEFGNIAPDAVTVDLRVANPSTDPSGTLISVVLSNGEATGQVNLTLPGSFEASCTDTDQLLSSNTVAFDAIPGSAVEYIIIDPPDGDPNDPSAPGSTDTPIAVRIEARDQYSNIATAHFVSVTLVVDGEAEFVSGTGVASMVGGVGIVAVKNGYVGTINLRLADDQTTTLNVESTQSVKYYWGAPKFLIVRNPESGTLRSQLPVTVEVQDAYENVVESETCEVTLNLLSLPYANSHRLS